MSNEKESSRIKSGVSNRMGHDDGTYFGSGERDRGKIRQMETFAYPHFSSTVHVALFVHVTNSAKLRARIIRASTLDGVEGQAEREAVNFAFVYARLVRDKVYAPSCGHCV